MGDLFSLDNLHLDGVGRPPETFSTGTDRVHPSFQRVVRIAIISAPTGIATIRRLVLHHENSKTEKERTLESGKSRLFPSVGLHWIELSAKIAYPGNDEEKSMVWPSRVSIAYT